MTQESSDPSTVRQWLEQLRQGSPEAAERLWARYVEKLSALIRRRLQRHGVRRVDDDDVLVDVFDSLCRGAQRGRFPRLEDQDDLWQVLVMLTNNKVVDQVRKSPLPHTESAVGRNFGLDGDQHPMPMVRDDEPTAEFAVEVADQLDHLLCLLDPEQLESMGLNKLGNCRGVEVSRRLKKLVAGKLELKSLAEIAAEIGWSETVARRGWELITLIWKKHAASARD
ncbi:MAG: hypothetical protein J5I93_13585 [Pirellulaceae bacterium]|nr:hypothetical protein [Pirellulaceae bacterium]